MPASARASNGALPGSTATGPIIPAARPPGPEPPARPISLDLTSAPASRHATRILFLKCSLVLLGSRAVRVWGRCSCCDLRIWISRVLTSLRLLAAAALVYLGPASAQDSRQNAPGEFDFYVLALSWSPSFCEAAAERGNSGRPRRNAAGGRIPSWCTGCGRNMSGLSRILPAAVAAAEAQHHDVDAGPDAGARTDLQPNGTSTAPAPGWPRPISRPFARRARR